MRPATVTANGITAYCSKVGNMVTVYFHGSFTAVVANGASILTLPAAYRPTGLNQPADGIEFTAGIAGYGNSRIAVKSNGQCIKWGQDVAVGSSLRCHAVFESYA
jgi:hypothetical protein